MLFIALLTYPKECVSLGLDGLNRWFHYMIPTLLPFMILSQLLIKLEYHTYFVSIFRIVLKPLYHINSHGIYVMVIGFLCGFPTGAKTCVSLYKRGLLTNHEANYLLAFTNQIGPIYYISFALPLLGITDKIPYIFGMYGIALLYGLCLRYTYYLNKITSVIECKSAVAPNNASIFIHLDEAIYDSLGQIAMLGGYMILFQLLNIIPVLLQLPTCLLTHIWGLLSEITNGLCNIPNNVITQPIYTIICLCTITFGGCCCMAQTFHVLKDTNLSLRSYAFHKVILTLLTGVYYLYLY
ncbi:MAG: hypothetical protein R3Y67_07375 [Eubacteriales bacterium]